MVLGAFNTSALTLHSLLTAKFLLALASTVILGSKPHRTHDHPLLSDDKQYYYTGRVKNLQSKEHT
jgi:hypothetical protein